MSWKKDGINVEDERLTQLIKAFGGKIPTIKIGILGKGQLPHYSELKPGQKPPTNVPTNAEVGAAHEFGTSRTTRRSWLREPLINNLKKFLEKAGAFEEESLKKVIQEGTIYPWMKRIAIVALDVVLGAFATGGYGKWKPSNMEHKKVHMTLVETQQLRNSVTEEVG